MKTLFYLYELEKWSDLIIRNTPLPQMPAKSYIIMHIERLQELLEDESHIASDKYALEHDTCHIGAYNKIVKDRNDAIEFWQSKLLEF